MRDFAVQELLTACCEYHFITDAQVQLGRRYDGLLLPVSYFDYCQWWHLNKEGARACYGLLALVVGIALGEV